MGATHKRDRPLQFVKCKNGTTEMQEFYFVYVSLHTFFVVLEMSGSQGGNSSLTKSTTE